MFFIFSIPDRCEAQPYSIVLGRPTNQSVTASILFADHYDYYLEYGSQPGQYSHTTTATSNTPGIPDEIDMVGLNPNQQYYYRLQYRPFQSGNYTAAPEHHFFTQRATGSTFRFTLEADEHLYDKKGVDNMYRITLANQLKDQPDFMMSLGDIFGDDHTPNSTTLADMDSLHKAYRPFLNNICQDVPFYVCLGNHEGEKDYYLHKNPPNNIAVYGTLTRKKYYPNPYPNAFYSGDTTSEGFGMGQPENFYAFNWGDALFVVLDVYRYDCDTTPKPHNWSWSLGRAQYDWLKSVLQQSSARYKFVFAHHVRGEDRGGVTNAPLYEWGGYDGANGTTYSFDTQRPGWGKPIHQLFKDYGVNIFFQGHDHLFAHEVLDSIVYQEVPMAADSTYQIGMLANADAYISDTLDGTGHIRVTVSPCGTTVDYVRAYLPKDTVGGLHHNGEVAFSYTVGKCPEGIASIDDHGLAVYPNPAQCKVHLLIPTDLTNGYGILRNNLGQPVLQTSSSQFSVEEIPSGWYTFTWYAEQGPLQQSLLISH